MFSTTDLAARIGAFAASALVAVFLAGCGEEPEHIVATHADQPLSPQMLALMQEKGTTPAAPMLIRTYKKEAEFEIWKMRSDGQYALLKTYPMCRWSGQLGPKRREGDRQVPEGFYWITPAQMNPNSEYYLSFNVGYPNAYDRAHGATGESIMVHGACSSAGCFSMTDEQIAEIYVVAREAFAGGQRKIQMQSLPFHMTPENFAKYRLDPNIAFWKELKTGSDNFEATRQEVAVGVCGDQYVFNAEPANGTELDPTGACPKLKHDPMVEAEVVAKQKRDDARIAQLVAEGVKPVHTVYADGGQNASFASRRGDVSRPEALAAGPVDVAINAKHKTPTPAQLKAAEAKDLAEAKAEEKRAAALREARAASENADKPEAAQADVGSQPAAAASPAPQPAAVSDNSILHHLFGARQPSTPAPAQASAQPVAQEQATEPAMTDNSAFYEQTQPRSMRTTQDSTDASDEPANGSDATAPPLRKQAQTSDAAQETTNASQAGATSQPAQPAQAPAQNDAFSGAAAMFKQGFSALTTPSNQ